MKRILSLLVAMIMALGCVGISAMAEDAVVTTIKTTDYDSFAAAMTAANKVSGVVEVEISSAVEFTDGMELKGNYTSITFVGKSDDAKVTINQTAGGDYLEAHGKTVAFTDLTLAKANPAWSGNSGHMGNYFSVQGGTVTYTNCTFPNGACTNTGTATYNNCIFENTSEYGLWVYDDALVTVNGGTIDSKKGIKVYSEGETSVTSTLTVQNATFTENVTAKPAVAIGYAESITLIGNTYNNTTGVLELDSGSDADCEGVTFVAEDANGNDIASTLTAVDRSNSNAACGVLVDGKIYTTVTTAAAEATSGSTVTLLHDSTETVELPEGVTLNANGFTAENVTEKVSAVAYIGETGYETVQAAIDAAKNGEIVTITAGEYSPINISNKNITIQGTVGDDGEMLTTIKGGNPAITGHSFNGTIKDIKIVDAWKVMYAEPAGNVTVDNVYVTGATYGFHLVAYSTGLTWKIENSYMDLAWANSFGVYGNGYADIIIRGNEFVSTNPYYPDYGAIHVNSFLPSVTVEENIFGKNARIYIDGSVTDTSKIKISKNYHAEGVENAFANDGVAVEIDSYYTAVDENGNLTGLVVPPKGSNSLAYTKEVDGYVRVWGEGGGNAKESFVLKLYSEDTLMATTQLNNVGGIIDGDVYVTWNFFYPQSNDEYWTTTWEKGHPNALDKPTKVELYIDGTLVSTTDAQMNGADGINPVVWEKLGGVMTPELPNAEVTNLGMVTVGKTEGDYQFGDTYFIYDLIGNTGLKSANDDFDLNIAMQFVAKDSPEEAAANAYADNTTDFFIKIDGLANGSFVGNGCYLAGYYPSFEKWVKIPLDGFTVENGKVYPVISSAGFDFKYVDICTSVQDFICGIYLTPEILEENPDINVNLALGLSENLDAAQKAEFKEVDAYTYDSDDFKAVASIGTKKYSSLQEALVAAAAATGNVTVEILDNIDLTNVDWNPVTVSAPGYPVVTVNGNKKIITGLNDMLFAGTWAGGSGLIINDLTIKDSTIVNDKDDAKGTVGVGAFIGYPQASATITLNNCHLVNSTVEGGHWTGGLIGMAGGYNGNDGPVFMNLTITGCSVTGATITGKGSAGGVIGHGSCAAWTNVVIEDTKVSGNTITSTGSSTNKAGAVMGTIGAAGQATTANGVTKTGGAAVSATVNGNTVTSGGTTITTIYGRQGSTTGMLYVTGGKYDNNPIETNAAYAQPKEGFEIVQNEDGTFGLQKIEEVEKFDFYGSNAVIGNSLSMDFYVADANLDGTNYYAEIKHYAEDKVITTQIPYGKWEVASTGYHKFSYSELAAKQIADKLEVAIFTTDGTQVSVTREDGLRAYAFRAYDKYAGKDNITDDERKLLTAVTDMLNYGAAAQIEFTYNTNSLANAGTEAYQQYATATTPELEDIRVKDDKVYGTNVTLEENIILSGYFADVTSDMYAIITFTDHYGNPREIKVDYTEFMPNGSYYQIDVDELAIADAAVPVTITVYDKDNTKHSEVVESVNSYLCRAMKAYPGKTIFAEIAEFAASAFATLHNN